MYLTRRLIYLRKLNSTQLSTDLDIFYNSISRNLSYKATLSQSLKEFLTCWVIWGDFIIFFTTHVDFLYMPLLAIVISLVAQYIFWYLKKVAFRPFPKTYSSVLIYFILSLSGNKTVASLLLDYQIYCTMDTSLLNLKSHTSSFESATRIVFPQS